MNCDPKMIIAQENCRETDNFKMECEIKNKIRQKSEKYQLNFSPFHII